MKTILTIFVFLFSTIALAESQMTLDSFLKLIKERNLDLKVEGAQLEAAEANAVGVRIPAPMVSGVQMRQGGSTASGYEINQTIPFPGKIIKEKSARNSEAKAQTEMNATRKREILSDAKMAYIEYWLAFEKVRILSERQKIILDHLRLARSGARSDSLMKVHLLRAESDFDLLENEIEEAKQEIIEKKLKLSVLLNQEANIDLPEPKEPPASEFSALNLKDSHQVRAAQWSLESFDAKESEAKQSWLPDFNIRYREIGASAMNPSYTETMIGITVPFILPWEPYSISNRASAERAEAQYRFEKTKRETVSMKESLVSRAKSIKIQLSNLTEKLIPRAEKRLKLIHNIAPRDMESLQDHRETMETFAELKMKALELREKYERTIAELEKYAIENGEKHE